jgi:integrase
MTEQRARRTGNITRRGTNSWRVKIAAPKGADGRRRTRYITVRGSRQDAQRALAAALLETNPVTSSRITLGHYVERWITDRASTLGAKTHERQTEIVQRQIVPFLGSMPLQNIRNADIAEWHAALLLRGNAKGGPLGRATIASAHRVLYRALEDAVRLEMLARNPCAAVKPPRLPLQEARSLQVEHVAALLEALQAPAHRASMLRPIVILALAAGLRRGEILGLRWRDLDLEARTLTVAQAVEQTKLGGVRLKSPKSAAGRRTISLAPTAVEALREWRTVAAETRLACGQGRPEPDALVFTAVDGISPRNPDSVSKAFERLVQTCALPPISLHGLRHTHASALIRGAMDIRSVAARLGHTSAQTTLRTYAHQFETADHTATAVVENMLKPQRPAA